MSRITTHVLDTSRGVPAVGVRVSLEHHGSREDWRRVADGVTDAGGRLRTLLPESAEPAPGLYRLTFETGAYFASHGVRTFFPHVCVTFEILEPGEHFHVPLLLSPFGYTTYRGS